MVCNRHRRLPHHKDQMMKQNSTGRTHLVKWEDVLYFYDNYFKGKGPTPIGKRLVKDPRYDEVDAMDLARTLTNHYLRDGCYLWQKKKENTNTSPPPPPKKETSSTYKKDRLWWQDELNLSDDPSIEEIKKNYRELVKRFHPDTGGPSAKFQSIVEAYNCACYYAQEHNG